MKIKYIGLVDFGSHYAAEFRRVDFGFYDKIVRYDLPNIARAIANFDKFDKDTADELRKGQIDLKIKEAGV